ncbi:MAG TPA: DNA polymerase IV [Verrucomicrobiae bacterium]|nr:DNA polymerase IV [Verrucomicrobiae bacterium]
MKRQILHLVIPSFPVALARTVDPALRGRPVAVAPLHSERALLQYVSAEAEAEGVLPGTPVFRARRLCPSLILIPPDPVAFSRGNSELGRLSGEFTPLVEPAAGRVFLDVTASVRLFGPARDVALKLERRIVERMGLQAQAGSGANKLVSRVAAGLPADDGVYDVPVGGERTFLAPFPVSVLPGVGREREGQLLHDLNLRKVAQVAALTVPQLRLAVGAFAPLLHDRACGIDRSPVRPPRSAQEVTEELFLDQEEHDDRVLLAEVCRLAEECGAVLRRLRRCTRRITLCVGYADGVTEQRSTQVPSASTDAPLFSAAEELFLRTCRRRVRVRSLRLACDISDAGQPELFQADEILEASALQEALDTLRQRFGRGAVRWGRTISPRRGPPTLPSPPTLDLSEHRYCTLTRRGG